jgi:hypothetical protein
VLQLIFRYHPGSTLEEAFQVLQRKVARGALKHKTGTLLP